MADSTAPGFWDDRYRAGRTPWDFHGVPADLGAFLRREPGGGRHVLIPGCGSGYEIRAFVEHGWTVTALDFSPAAVARARAVVGPSSTAQIHEADFFAIEFAAGGFDAIYERTFVCALPPDRWPDLVQRVARWLAPGGGWFGYYYFGPKDDGPPFGLAPAELEALLPERWALLEDRPTSDPLPLFAGAERWQRRVKPTL